MNRLLIAFFTTLAAITAQAQDFKPAGAGNTGDHLLVVAAGSPHRTLDSFVGAARSKPGAITVGTNTTMGKVGVEMFNQQTGVTLSMVPYRASGFLKDVSDGFLDSALVHNSVAGPMVASGVLREIAVVNLEKSAELPKSAL